MSKRIRKGDCIVFKSGKCYEVTWADLRSDYEGELFLAELDENGTLIGEEFPYTLDISSPIRDVIR